MNIESHIHYDARSPLVSIIIMNLNKPKMTIDCLEELWKKTTGARYEVIVVDNGSTPENQQELFKYKGPHKVINLAINRFLGEGNNIGAEAAKGEFILFLNNDMMVNEGWLEPLLDVFQTHADVGCSGPKIVYPSGELQEAGALLDTDGTTVQIGKFQAPDNPRFNRMRAVDYVSGACIMMRRQDFMDVLGFDFRYEPAYYEDCDLCLKIGSLGKKTYYVPESEVVHYESMTTMDSPNSLKLHSIGDLNRSKFASRWQNYLNTGIHAERIIARSLVPKPPSSATRRAGLFTPYSIVPGGGERYLFSVMEVFASEGYALTLIVPEIFSRIRLTTVLQNLDLDLAGLEIITLEQAQKGDGFDLFYCLGNEICPRSEAFGDINIYCCQFPFKSNSKELKRRLPWLAKYDVIICYSAFVEDAILKMIEDMKLDAPRVEVVSPPVGLVTDVDPNAQKSGVLSIGRFFAGGHCKRQDMMIEVVRDLLEQDTDIDLNLLGSLHPEPEHREYMTKCRKSARGLPVNFYVDAPPQKLGELLKKASFYWHGAGFGVNVEARPELCEHFGISVIEAMSARVIPFVVNNGGPSSIVQDGVSGFHYSSKEELIRLTNKVIAMPENEIEDLRDRVQERAREYSYSAFRARLKQVLADAQLNPILLDHDHQPASRRSLARSH